MFLWGVLFASADRPYALFGGLIMAAVAVAVTVSPIEQPRVKAGLAGVFYLAALVMSVWLLTPDPWRPLAIFLTALGGAAALGWVVVVRMRPDRRRRRGQSHQGRPGGNAVTDAEYAALLCEHMPVDAGIVRAVRVLQDAGVETFESCEGGDGHCFPEPTVRFHGQAESMWRALAACQEVGLPVLAVRRAWSVVDGEPSGPYGEVVFRQKL